MEIQGVCLLPLLPGSSSCHLSTESSRNSWTQSGRRLPLPGAAIAEAFLKSHSTSRLYSVHIVSSPLKAEFYRKFPQKKEVLDLLFPWEFSGEPRSSNALSRLM
jgi:hypothetical protein